MHVPPCLPMVLAREIAANRDIMTSMSRFERTGPGAIAGCAPGTSPARVSGMLGNRLADVLMKATLLAVPAGCCPPPETYTTTASRAMYQMQIDACLADDLACEPLCRAVLGLALDATVTRCTIVSTTETDVVVKAAYVYPCVGGRRPDGFTTDGRVSTTAGEWIAQSATLEAASVIAFARLVRILAAHGAPAELIADARLAVADELLHAQLMARLAVELGAAVEAPVVAARAPATLEQLACENAVEGQVAETLGALVASCQARAAVDPALRAVFSVLARDEARHADLAYRVAAWLDTRLEPTARAAVASRRRDAIAQITTNTIAPGLDRHARELVGLPEPAVLAAAARHMFDTLAA
jgi:hypothetical protein